MFSIKKIAWITDSTCGLSKDEAEKLGIYMVPMVVMFGDESYRDGEEISCNEFYKRIEKEQPKTSQPFFGDYISLYEKLKEEYECGIAVHLSSNLSGTLQSSKSAANSVDFPLEVIDSLILSLPLVEMIKEGMKMESEGKEVQEIVNALHKKSQTADAYVVIEDLSFLHRGGRMNGTQFLLGSMLQIKPIITFRNGSIEVFEKVRTGKKAKIRIFELLDEAIQKDPSLQVAVAHTNSQDLAKEWKREIQEKYPNVSIHITELGPAIGVHGGSGLIGMVWCS